MTAPLYTAHEDRAHEVFEAVMFALSRPGEAKTLPQTGLAQFIETLVDLDTSAMTLEPSLEEALRMSRARLAPLKEAEHVFVTGAEAAESIAEDLSLGSALYPDLGATLYVAAAHEGTRLKLTGPGIQTQNLVETALSPAFWATRNARQSYPEGFEVVIVDDSRVLAIPRSTKVEVL